MTRKMLIKVTVDEALYPELYQRLDELNPRLRAAVLRSLASDTARAVIGGREFVGAGKRERLPAYAEQPVEALSAPKVSALPASSISTVAAHSAAPSRAADQDLPAQLDRFNYDEIGDQFSNF